LLPLSRAATLRAIVARRQKLLLAILLAALGQARSISENRRRDRRSPAIVAAYSNDRINRFPAIAGIC
jgi:hypothetical protein